MCVIAMKVAVNVIQSSRMERCFDRIVVLAYHDPLQPHILLILCLMSIMSVCSSIAVCSCTILCHANFKKLPNITTITCLYLNIF